MRFLGMVLFVPLSCASAAQAACTGSGLTWTCAAGSTVAQVQSAVNSAADKATITFAAGTYMWTSGSINLANSNGVTLACATVRGCAVAFGSGGVFYLDSIPAPLNELIRISGFVFTGAPGTAAIWLYGASNIEKLRIDHNTFSDLPTGAIAILLGEVTAPGSIRGVIDHNIFSGPTNFMGVKSISGDTWLTGLQGTSQNLFIEDNTFNFSDNTDLGTGAIDGWRATGVVFRYNTLTNTRYVNHSLCHGGPANAEVYGNTIVSPTPVGTPNYRNIHFQGSGEIIVFDNTVGAASTGHIAIQHYRSDASQMPQGACTAALVCDGTQNGSGTVTSPKDGNRTPLATHRGYPCWHQPGRDADATLRPVYLWNNKNPGGARVSVSVESAGYIASHFLMNRDYYEAGSASAQTSPTAPFDGTSGVGFGTVANRPVTCTTGSEVLDDGKGGVGYFATDVGPQGTLYRCSATNTWTVHYAPFTYPHPLVTGSSGDVLAPAAPTNLQAQ